MQYSWLYVCSKEALNLPIQGKVESEVTGLNKTQSILDSSFFKLIVSLKKNQSNRYNLVHKQFLNWGFTQHI